MRATWQQFVRFIVILVAAVVLGTLASSQEAADASAEFAWEELGSQTYTGNCSSCHQPSGQGVAGAFPPLAGHMPALYEAEGGREYLINVVLYGLQGEISVNGQNFSGVMPGWAQLSDEQIAAVLNHELTAWNNEASLPDDFQPILPADVANARTEQLTAEQVHQQRQSLGLDGEGAAEGGDAQAAMEAASVWDGVFTEEQAARAQEPYSANCAGCHGRELQGGESAPSLTGGLFMLHWAGDSVADLFEFTRTQMPLGRPGSLSDQAYIDIIARILQANGFPAGSEELEPDPEALQQIVIEREQ